MKYFMNYFRNILQYIKTLSVKDIFGRGIVILLSIALSSIISPSSNAQFSLNDPESLIQTLVQGDGMIYLIRYDGDMEDVHLTGWYAPGPKKYTQVVDERVEFIAKGESYKVQNFSWSGLKTNGQPLLILCLSFKSGNEHFSVFRFLKKHKDIWEWKKAQASVTTVNDQMCTKVRSIYSKMQ